MITSTPQIRMMLVGLAIFLSGCFIQPGKFAAELTLLEDDKFTYTYEGELHFVGLAKMMEESKRSSGGTFQSYCYGPAPEGAAQTVIDAAEAAADATEAAQPAVEGAVDIAIETNDYSDGPRECTAEEEATQRAEWEERQERRRAKDKREAEQLSKMTGGIDFSDPDAEQELAALLLRQKGFDRVEAKGDGTFDISYAIEGTLTHDFAFPVMEGFPSNSPFIQLIVRDGDMVRVNAPGFVGQFAGNPLGMLMLAGPGMGGGLSASEQEDLNLPEVDGTFSIVTTGDIRANNTDEGAVSEAGRQRLIWKVNSRTQAAPTALIAKPK